MLILIGAPQERTKQVISKTELMTLSPHDWQAL